MSGVRLVPWAEDDLVLLHRCNSAEMMAFLGGPVEPVALERRHQTYLELPWSGKGAMYRVDLDDGRAAGSVGHWLTEWRGEIVWETGWMVLPGFQGRGVATAAARAVVDLLRGTGGPRYLHAYPVVGNAASNAICRSAGFTSRGECDFEYPPGTKIRCHDWRVDLDRPATDPTPGHPNPTGAATTTSHPGNRRPG